MSGFEKEELQLRMQGMALEEQKLVAETLPDEVIFEEMTRRYINMREMVRGIGNVIMGGRKNEEIY
ncbi:hypothetical protein C819_02263 [Lachnospiraceae bacterium 10-1]|nr:hypothetical protein C819_02263 [Lachnospiraceae bacterium 10-1]